MLDPLSRWFGYYFSILFYHHPDNAFVMLGRWTNALGGCSFLFLVQPAWHKGPCQKLRVEELLNIVLFFFDERLRVG